jgi:membrane-associated phospholipid phosphatase
MAASLFLLVFDWWYRRKHFWWALGPTVGLWVATVYLRYHYGVDVLAGIVLALACLWLTRWYANSSLCSEVEAECEAHGKRVVETPESV